MACRCSWAGSARRQRNGGTVPTACTLHVMQINAMQCKIMHGEKEKKRKQWSCVSWRPNRSYQPRNAPVLPLPPYQHQPPSVHTYIVIGAPMVATPSQRASCIGDCRERVALASTK